MPPDNQRALVILKPDCLRKELVDTVIKMIEGAGLKIVRRECRLLLKEEIESLYSEHKSDNSFDLLVQFMLSGPCNLIMVEGPSVISILRTLKGRSGTSYGIRGEFSTSFIENIIHTSDTATKAHHELRLFFPDFEGHHNPVSLVIGISGPSESGKSTAGEYFRSRGCRRVKLVQLLEQARRAQWSHYVDTDCFVRGLLANNPIGLRVLVGDLISVALEESANGICSVESMGDPATIQYLQSRFGREFMLIFVDAPIFRRSEFQQKLDPHLSKQEAMQVLQSRDSAKEELWRISAVRSLAQSVIVNDGTLEDLYANLRKAVNAFLQSPVL